MLHRHLICIIDAGGVASKEIYYVAMVEDAELLDPKSGMQHDEDRQ